MKGSIRFFVGLIMTMGVVGGMDTATDAQLFVLTGLAVVSLGLMYSGTKAMNRM